MLKSSLIEILRSLNKNELKSFEDFILSPYFNKNTSVIKLFRIIRKYSPEFTDNELKREAIWAILFPEKDYNYGVMKNMVFDLQKLITMFLGYEGIRKKDFLFRLSFLEELSEKNLDQQFEKNVKIYSEILNKQKINDTYFFENTRLEGLKYNHYIIKKAREGVENQYLADFEQFLLLDFLRQYFILNNNVLIFNKEFKKNSIDSSNIETNVEALFQSVLKFHSDTEEQAFFKKIILMYYNGYKLTVTGESSYYFELKKFLYEYSIKLDLVELYNIYNLLTGFCVNRSLEGDNSFYAEEFDLYKMILEKEAYTFYKDGFMNRITYYNITRTGIMLKEFEWTIDFLNKYKSKLPESARAQTYLYNYAFVEFGRKEYIKALEILSGLSHFEVRDKPREKMLYLMLYYELGYREQLLSFVDSCRHFAKNDKLLSDQYNKKFLSFVNCILTLSKIKFNINDTDIMEAISILRQSIDGKDVSLKHWLLEKIDELEAG